MDNVNRTHNRADLMKRVFKQLNGPERDSTFGKPSPLSEAISNLDIAEVTRLIDNGADVNERDEFTSTPLHDAVQSAGASEELKRLRESLNTVSQAAIKPVEERQHPTDLKEFFAKIGSFKPSANSVQDSLRTGADRRRKIADDPTNNPPKAVDASDLALIHLLIERGADVQARHYEGQTPLHISASSGTVQVAQILLSAGANIEVQDDQGKTPLMLAAEECQPEMVQFLIDRGANIHARSKRGITPLMSAAHGGSRRVIETMIGAGAEVNAYAEDGSTALLAAAMRGYDDVVMYLREQKAEIGLLEALVLSDQSEVERLAKLESACVHAPSWGRSVIFWSARESRPVIIRLLHGLGASVNAEDSRGHTAVFAAGMRGTAETMQALLECGAGMAAPKKEHGFSPLRWAASMGDLEKVRLLLSAGADVNEKAAHGETPLLCAVMKGEIEIVRELLNAGANPNDQGMGLSPLAFASARGDTEMFRLLVENGAEVRPIRDADGTRHSFAATSMPGVKENPEIMAIVRDATSADLYDAAKAGDNEAVLRLLASGQDLHCRQDGDQTPLHAAAKNGHLDTVRILQDRGADLHRQNIAKQTPLHSAILHGHLATAQLLVSSGADVDAASGGGMTPLMIAAVSRHNSRDSMVSWLLDSGARVGICEAAALGDVATLRNLLDFGLDPHETVDGLTPLMAAAMGGQDGAMDLLLARGAKVDQRDNDGRTALTLAFARGEEKSIRLLLAAGADINGATEANRDPELGVDFATRWTPLQSAILSGKRELVELALERGADLEGPGLMGQTPLHVVVFLPEEKQEIADLLLARGANIEARSWNSDTPLITAAQSGKAWAVKLLLEHGADSKHRNTMGQNALAAAKVSPKKDSAVIQLLEGK